MTVRDFSRTEESAAFALSLEGRGRLRARLELAVQRARRSGQQTLATLTLALGTPIRAQQARPLGAIELRALMHPMPAVGGEPPQRAKPLIPALEGMDRGWYAGPVGWTDATGDGEFCVALRCALLRGEVARCYAGVGVVRDSDPAAELSETEIKLAALLPLLAG